MRNTKIAIGTVAALSLGTVLITGPAPASAGSGLSQTIAAQVRLDVPVKVTGSTLCLGQDCRDVGETTQPVVTDLELALTYELAKATELPNVLSQAGRLKFPVGSFYHEKCNGKFGVYVLATGSSITTTSVSGKAHHDGDKKLDHNQVGTPTGTPTLPEAVFCVGSVTVTVP